MRSQVDAINTDFAKAFDKGSHSALLAKLARLGIHSALLNWIKSYLHYRLYRVNINRKFSDSYLATSGLPQGSDMYIWTLMHYVSTNKWPYDTKQSLFRAEPITVLGE